MPDQNGNVINLEDFVGEDKHVLVGREKGRKARKESEIEEKARQYDNIRVIVPDGLYAVSPTFLEEFLRPVVQKLGKSGFYQKFNFEHQGPYDITTDLKETVRRLTREPHVT